MTATKTAALKRYRQAHPRIDYYPSRAARAVIGAWGRTLDPTLAGTLDKLILAGDRALRAAGREPTSGNSGGR